MFKAVCLLKRRPGMSFEEFVEYYETNHRKLGEKWLNGPTRYVRRYLHPVNNPVSGETPELDYDVLTEMWFETREAFDVAMAALSRPEAAQEILEDEVKLFDRSKISLCWIEERESDLR
ncbi:EthD domain-containing protein [Sphingomonas sp. SRS2]|uniref:EthD domain-containing protein n=1 Tax=Sphingomonas sp. SRS2 TaxID=133190 RepID=UPI0006183FEC|nr:EthD domain-containing protein [Sphingomonas sp. SRS2]KKC27301.1 hypothetical protein WP12_03905 [Sphingomonas sp. SRS2]